MGSKLDWVGDWERLAEAAGYNTSRMASELKVTARLLQSFFHARFGTSPHEWTLRLRMNRAAKLLRNGSLIKIVASEVGYKQISHFSREFKRVFGVSPTHFRFVEMKKQQAALSHLDNELRV